MRKIRNLIKLANLFLLIIMLFFLAQIHNAKMRGETKEAEQEVFVSASDVAITEEETEAPNYREYLPVYRDGEEYNLYDLISAQQIIYFKRENCTDCETYGPVILSRLKELDYPYLTIEVSKEPEAYENGISVHSAVVKSIGLSEVPALAFIRNGEWITKLENEFTMAGTEIPLTCQQVFH